VIYSRDLKFISKATELANMNVKIGTYTISSILADKRRVLSYGLNSYKKTHPKTPQLYSFTLPTHAEVQCVSRYKGEISSDLTLYVSGITKAGINLVCSSMPCESCMEFIKSSGIKRVVYIENFGDLKISEILLI
jgi:tRNA(Arg) A34 adenosine deaminase TadA